MVKAERGGPFAEPSRGPISFTDIELRGQVRFSRMNQFFGHRNASRGRANLSYKSFAQNALR